MRLQTLKPARFFAPVAMLLALSSAHAAEIKVTITNTSGAGGLSLTPTYFGFHDGSVDLFNAGEAASAGIEAIAELGDFSVLRNERLAQQATSAGGVGLGTGGAIAGPIEPGETASFVIDLDPVLNRYAFFASMIVPSNDTFIGVDNPTAFSLFNDAGVFNGPFSIDVTSAFAYDAGTEVNDATNGPAFVAGIDATAGLAEDGVISAATSLSDFVGLLLAGGLTLSADQIDFLNTPGFAFARIEFSEVPLPPAVLLMGAGLLGLGAAGRRRKAAHRQASGTA